MAEVDLSLNMNDGGSLSEKLSESLKGLNVGDLMKNMLDKVQIVDEDTEEAKGKLQEIMDKYNSMTSEERDAFASKVKDVLASRLQVKLQDPEALKNLSGFEDALNEAVMNRIYLMGAVVAVIIFIIVFISYKLYKSIKDKELKKEEKKKAKLMKKKK